MSSSNSNCPRLSIKWTHLHLVTDSGTKCAWVIHESKAVQVHVHNNRCCLYVPWVLGSVKNPHNNNDHLESKFYCLLSLFFRTEGSHDVHFQRQNIIKLLKLTVLKFYDPVNHQGHVEPVSLPNHTFPGPSLSSKQLTSISAHFLARNWPIGIIALLKSVEGREGL